MRKITFILPVVFASLLLSNASCQQPQKPETSTVTNVEAPEFKKMIDRKEGLILDVRTPQEFSEGHIKGAINIDFQADNFKEEIEKLDRSKIYDVYCRSGKRSAAAATVMGDFGFKNVVNLKGGILGWQEQGFEVEK